MLRSSSFPKIERRAGSPRSGLPHPEFFGALDAVAEMASGVLHPDEGEAAE
ncbi:hypothetical protein [Saccharopolyspora rectivirgula]|uniref:hypothetical protein n=1 Tax=Saccharopolyspora rectivirgula TaxID=28042 RepID=UPI00240A0DAD|nr:hypothetical protein [Saccharopolyspora rectivirgula]